MQEVEVDPAEFEDVGEPEGNIYPGFWWVQWSGLQSGGFVVKHLHFRHLGVPSHTGDKWILDGLTHDPGADFICGALPGPGDASPTLTFSPDHRGRAYARYTDAHGEGAVTLTSLGDNLIEGLTGYRLEMDLESERLMMKSLMHVLNSEPAVDLDAAQFRLEACVGAFVDKAWSIELSLTVPGLSFSLLELDGVTDTSRRTPKQLRVTQHLLDMAEFEGYREFGPLDSSSPYPLHMRSLVAATEAINTPIPLDRELLALLREPGDDYFIAAGKVPRALYIAALIVQADQRTAVGRARSTDWLEAHEQAQWILGITKKTGLIEQRDMIATVFGAVASLTTAEQAECLFDAELFVASDQANIEATFPGLGAEVSTLRVQLLWRERRDELVDIFRTQIDNELERFDVAVDAPSEERPIIFAVDLTKAMTLHVSPRMHVGRGTPSNSQHENEYWLNWESDPAMNNGMKIDLDHRLVQIPEVVAGIVSHTIRHHPGITPEKMSWRAVSTAD